MRVVPVLKGTGRTLDAAAKGSLSEKTDFWQWRERGISRTLVTAGECFVLRLGFL